MAKRLLVLIFFITTLILFFGVGPSFADKIDRAYAQLDDGVELERKGKIWKALDHLQRAWDVGGITEACYRIAEIYDKKLNDNRKAVKYYTKFLEIEYDSPLASKAQDLLNRAKRDIIATEKWKNDLAEKKFSVSEHSDPIRRELGPTEEKKKKELKRLQDAERKYSGQPTPCLTCHGGYMGPGVNMEATHPVGRIPTGKLAETVPWEARFYKIGRVECLSCHDPTNLHFSEGTEGKTFKTLRVATDGGENLTRFCAFCHKGKVSQRVIRDRDRQEREMEDERDMEYGDEDEGDEFFFERR